MKKIKRSAIIKKLDKKVSLEVRSLGYCEWCDQVKDTLQCAHIISRTYVNTRFDKDNLLCLCAGCHMKWHKEPIEAVRWLELRFPGRYDRVNRLRNLSVKISTNTLVEMLED